MRSDSVIIIKNKLISIFVLLSLMLNMFTIVNAEEEYTLSDAATVLHGLGIVEDVSKDIMTSPITRGEVAYILYTIGHFGEEKKSDSVNINLWENEFFGELSQELKIPREQKAPEFNDVLESSYYYDAVNYVTRLNLMRNELNNFNVDGDVTYIEAIEILLDFMGYKGIAENMGEFPDGYKQIALEKGLGISKEENEILTYDDFLQLLYKCFDVEIPQTNFDSSGNLALTFDDKDTFLSKILGLNIMKGRVTDNGITNLYSQSSIRNIAIDGLELEVSDNCEYIRTFLGYQVACFYTNNEHDDAPVAMYAHKIKEQNNITFAIKDFEEITKTQISYEKNNKIVNVKLNNGYHMIVNGMAESSYSNEHFDFDYGTVTVVKNSDGVYDLVLIEGYNSCYVMNVDKINNIIYNKIAKDNEDNAYFLDNYDYVSIVNSEGETKSFLEINTNKVIDISENDNIIKIVITDGVNEQITVRSIHTDEAIIHGDEQEYFVAKSFLNSYNPTKIELKTTYNAYFNNANQIIWLEKNANLSDWTAAYLIKTYYNDESDEYCVRVFTENGEHKDYVLYDKVKIYDTNGEEYRFTPEQAYEWMKNCTGLTRIKQYDEKVRQIEFPLENAKKAKSNDRLFKIYQTTEPMFTNGISFGAKSFWNSDTVVMSIPEDIKATEKYSLQSTGIFKNTTTHKFESFGTDPRSMVSKYFTTSSSQTTTINEKTPVMVVSDIIEELYNDEVCYAITGLLSNETNQKTIYVPYDSNIMNNIGTPYKELTQRYELEIGDIIRYTLDSDGYADYLEIIFDANAENPLYSYAKKGWILGSDGKAPTDNTRVANPYTISHGGNLDWAQDSSGYSQNRGMRIIYGWVSNYRDGVITISTQSPRGGFNEELEENGTSYSESYVYNKAKITYVTYDGKECIPMVMDQSAIKDYFNYGSNCSRALILTCYGDVRCAVFMD